MGLSLQKTLRFLKPQETMSKSTCRSSSRLPPSAEPAADGLTVFEIHHTVGRERESRGREDTQNVLAHCSLMQAPPQLICLLKGCDLFPLTSVLPHTISRSPPPPLLPRSALSLLLFLSQGPPSGVNSPSSSRSLLSAGITGMDHPAWFSHLKCKLLFQNIFFPEAHRFQQI